MCFPAVCSIAQRFIREKFYCEIKTREPENQIENKMGKKARTGEIVFDRASRVDFVTGFKRRKDERRKEAKKQIEKELKEEVRERRREKRQQMRDAASRVHVLGEPEIDSEHDEENGQQESEDVYMKLDSHVVPKQPSQLTKEHESSSESEQSEQSEESEESDVELEEAMNHPEEEEVSLPETNAVRSRKQAARRVLCSPHRFMRLVHKRR
jgi:hypothetical protein